MSLSELSSSFIDISSEDGSTEIFVPSTPDPDLGDVEVPWDSFINVSLCCRISKDTGLQMKRRLMKEGVLIAKLGRLSIIIEGIHY